MSERLPKTLRRRAANPLCATCRHLRSLHDKAERICHGSVVCACYGWTAGDAA